MDSEAIEEAAARWFAKRQSGTWSGGDQAEFDAWLEAATAHRIQYLRVATAWEHSARLKALGAGVPAGVIPDRGSWGDTRFLIGAPWQASPVDDFARLHGEESTDRPFPSESTASQPVTQPRLDRTGMRSTKRASFLALAASVLLLLVGGTYLWTSGLLTGDRYATPVGGIDTVALSDGSHVILNTDSRIRVELRERERRIALDRGEAFFEVAQDPRRPFIVEAGDKRVIAVGTKFAVRRDADDIQVVVTEGQVRVETSASGGSGAGDPLTIVEAGAGREMAHEVLLTAGSIARTAKDAVLVSPGAAPEAEKLLSWRKGYVTFDNTALADAVAEFNRYSTRKIFIADPAIAAIRVGGNFRSNNAAAFLWLLQAGFPIKVEQDGDRIVLKAK